MQLKAIPRTVNELLSVNKTYVIPRFQREYSWDVETVRDFWDDICTAVIWDAGTGKYACTEYFIGPLVLIGDDSSTEYSVVDGQQRLTTITLLLKCLVDAFQHSGEKATAEALYKNYIEGSDNDGHAYFKLKTESPKPYFQNELQFFTPKKKDVAKTAEEFALKVAFETLGTLVASANLAIAFPKASYKEALRIVRDQATNFLKVVYISVADEDDAYSIFETLNARGLNLSSTDLIKNTLLRRLKQTHPNDDAKADWNKLRQTVADSKTELDTFFRHYWNSKFGHSSNDRLYKAFKAALKNKVIGDESTFLTELVAEANTYKKISLPTESDWKPKHQKKMFYSLEAFDVFRVTQPRPFILALLQNKHIGDTSKKKAALRALENFHFMYTAICSLRASGLDGKYGSAARELRAAKSKVAAQKAVDALLTELKDKLPAKDVFTQGFESVSVTKKDDRQKRLLQYYFCRAEEYLRKGIEVVPSDMTIEHVQNQKIGTGVVGLIGNLVPLGGEPNSDLSHKPFVAKLKAYEKSSFEQTKLFAKTYEVATTWNEKDIEKRTKDLATEAYNNVFAMT